MATNRNIIQEMLSLRKQLEQECQQLHQRLAAIDAALGLVQGSSPVAAPVRSAPVKATVLPAPVKAAAPSAPPKAAVGRPAGSGGNVMTLRQRMTEATSMQPLSVREIVIAVKKAGHVFQSADPIKSVGSYLYGPEGKRHFKRANGKFSPAGGSSAPAAKAGAVAKPAKAKRTMSPAARKKVAEAVRAYWAKKKAGMK